MDSLFWFGSVENGIILAFIIIAQFSIRKQYLLFPADKIYPTAEKARLYKETLLTNQGEDIVQKKEEIEDFVDNFTDGMITRVYNTCIQANYNQNKKQKRVLNYLNMFTFFNIILTVILYVIIYIGG